ncbi:MAG TPA: CoA pyrophosphatase [Egibacteraceae bacterium]|nr:CoA pyrophosphatase [Egibacteraceae bacterium]
MSSSFTPDAWSARLAARQRRALQIAAYRRAAVLVPFTLEDEPRLLLTVRTSHLPTHQGQIAFPGGSIHAGETPRDAALREAHEEVGLEPTQVQVLGDLDDVWTPQGFHVTPVLGAFPTSAVLRHDPGEVAEMLLVPVADLRAIEPRTETRPLRPGTTLPPGLARGHVYHYDWRGHDIWGMTAQIVHDLLSIT